MSRAFKLLCDHLGLKCIYVTGKSIKNGIIEEDGAGHAWNAINIEGEWYQFDITWNNGNNTDKWANIDDRLCF